MKQIVEKAKANPVLTTLFALALGGGGTVATNLDTLTNWITLPARIERVEKWMAKDIQTKLEAGEITFEEAFELMRAPLPADGG